MIPQDDAVVVLPIREAPISIRTDADVEGTAPAYRPPVISCSSPKNPRFRADERPQATGTLW